MIRSPLFVIEPRTHELSRRGRFLLSLSSLVVALLVGAIGLALLRIDPLGTYASILHTSVLDGPYAIASTLAKATPLIMTGLACTVAFHANLWNVGAEGQLLLGAWAATGMATFWLPPDTPAWLMLLAMALAGGVAGAAWGGIAGALKARWGVSETLTSLMLVYVATEYNHYFIFALWSDRGFQMTPAFPPGAHLPLFTDLTKGWPPDIVGSPLNVGLLVALLAALLVGYLLARTRFGFRLRILGAGESVARYAGVRVGRTIVMAMLWSGFLAGLAGMLEVSGVVHRLQDRFSPGYGFTGILIAWLARLDPGLVVIASLGFGMLLVGGKELQAQGVPMMLQGIILLTLIASEVLVRNRLVWRPYRDGEASP